MKKTTHLKLLGHDCPLGAYPGPVVPIGIFQNRLVAIYYEIDISKPPHVQFIPDDCPFVRHSEPGSLPPFDPVTQRLFALSQSELRVYEVKYRTNFYLALLGSPEFSKQNPYLRLSMAKTTGDREIIQRELAPCWSELKSISSELVDLWYTSDVELQKILSDVQGSNRRGFSSQKGKKRLLRILVVEDDRNMRDAVADTLRFEGYEVILARDGEEALAKVRSQPGLAAMVLDVMLPKLNGYAVCKRVRDDSRCKSLPIIIATALAEDEQRSIEVGVSSYIRKPFEPSELLGKIIEVVQRKQAR
jgi:CheY-like chemotaxis protein